MSLVLEHLREVASARGCLWVCLLSMVAPEDPGLVHVAVTAGIFRA